MDGIELLLPHQISLCAGLSWKYLAVRNEKRRHLSKIQDTRNIVHRTMMPQCPSKWALGTSHSSPSRFWNPHRSASGSHTVSHQSLLTAARTCSTFSGVLLVADLPERESLSTDSQPSLKHLCHSFICAALIASALKAFWIIWIVSMEECLSLMQNLIQICCSICSVTLNAMATQYTCSLKGIYFPLWQVQWSHHCSHMCMPVHSPWLPGYINVMQTILIILTMAGLFPERPLYYASFGSEH